MKTNAVAIVNPQSAVVQIAGHHVITNMETTWENGQAWRTNERGNKNG